MNTCLIVGGLLLLGLVVYYWMNKSSGNKEGYLAAGALDTLDSLDGRYELVQSPESATPSEHFADMVDSGDQAHLIRQVASGELEKPIERLAKLQDTANMPLTSAHLPQYNIDVANPQTYSFSVNAPRVLLKNRLNMQADPYRGDVSIRYHPDVPLIAKSHHGRDAWRGDGFFSPLFSSLYDKLTGRAYKNMPIQVATEELHMDRA